MINALRTQMLSSYAGGMERDESSLDFGREASTQEEEDRVTEMKPKKPLSPSMCILRVFFSHIFCMIVHPFLPPHPFACTLFSIGYRTGHAKDSGSLPVWATHKYSLARLARQGSTSLLCSLRSSNQLCVTCFLYAKFIALLKHSFARA